MDDNMLNEELKIAFDNALQTGICTGGDQDFYGLAQ
jgi:hypothetical protein